jgi:hypothetical protein
MTTMPNVVADLSQGGGGGGGRLPVSAGWGTCAWMLAALCEHSFCCTLAGESTLPCESTGYILPGRLSGPPLMAPSASSTHEYDTHH